MIDPALDSDGDGLSDADELLYSTDPLDSDTDDDGLSDGAEVNTHGTTPTILDTDEDGLSDGDEVNLHGTDPNLVDTDEDGLTDFHEITISFTDPLVADTDGDGLSDGVDDDPLNGGETLYTCTSLDLLPNTLSLLPANSGTATVDLTINLNISEVLATLQEMGDWYVHAYDVANQNRIILTADGDEFSGTLSLTTSSGSALFTDNAGASGNALEIAITESTSMLEISYQNASIGDLITASVVGQDCTDTLSITEVLVPGEEDTEAPVITLIGGDEQIDEGGIYVDEGAVATDNVDGDISDDIQVFNPVDTDIPGSYLITYNVTDSAGNPAVQVTRLVEVLDVDGAGDGGNDDDDDDERREPREIDDEERDRIFTGRNCSDPFTDTRGFRGDELWFTVPVCIGYNVGVTTGVTRTSFEPNRNVTRAEMLAFLFRAAGIDDNDGRRFNVNYADVASTDWHRDIFALAKERDVIRIPDGGFVNPNGYATRADMAVWMMRVHGLTNFDYNIRPLCNDMQNSDPSAYAFATLREMKAELPTGNTTRVMTGLPDGSCQPNSLTNRAEAITFVLRGYSALGFARN